MEERIQGVLLDDLDLEMSEEARPSSSGGQVRLEA